MSRRQPYTVLFYVFRFLKLQRARRWASDKAMWLFEFAVPDHRICDMCVCERWREARVQHHVDRIEYDESYVIDVLADLRLACHRAGVDFYQCMDTSYLHYLEER
jgi:hypothetical protein